MKAHPRTPEHEAHLARRREYMRARRAAMSNEQRERERVLGRAQYMKHRDANLLRMKQWREKNPGAAAESSKQWRELNPGRQAELNRAWKEANAERYAAYVAARREEKNAKNREWQRKNKDLSRAKSAKRRTLKAANGGHHTRDDIAAILKLQRKRCAVCKDHLDSAYEVDHIHPVAKGGSNDRSNLQILCPLCNRRKGAKDPLDFMQARGFLL